MEKWLLGILLFLLVTFCQSDKRKYGNHFPSNLAFQTFLLDSNNKVVAIDDPVNNKAIRKFYNRILER